jgi:predicted phage tail protein
MSMVFPPIPIIHTTIPSSMLIPITPILIIHPGYFLALGGGLEPSGSTIAIGIMAMLDGMAVTMGGMVATMVFMEGRELCMGGLTSMATPRAKARDGSPIKHGCTIAEPCGDVGEMLIGRQHKP